VLPPVVIARPGSVAHVGLAPLQTVALVVVAVGAYALHHVGRDLRHHKSADRRLHLRTLGWDSRLDLLGIALLSGLLALAVFVGARRVLDAWPVPLAWFGAVGAAVAVPVVIVVIVGLAFLDGSPETDDARALERVLRPHLRARDGYLEEASAIQTELRSPSAPTVREAAASLWRWVGAWTSERRPIAFLLVAVVSLVLIGALAVGLLNAQLSAMLAFVAVVVTPVLAVLRAWRHAGAELSHREGPIADVPPRCGSGPG
jgi:hypothetical protein